MTKKSKLHLFWKWDLVFFLCYCKDFTFLMTANDACISNYIISYFIIIFFRYEVHMQDLESALTYCLRQEVAIHQDINGESLKALQHFVRILAKVSIGFLTDIFQDGL